MFFANSALALDKYLFFPLPTTVEYDRDKARLGKTLFLDPMLSRDRRFSCNSCHNVSVNGADNLSLSSGYQQARQQLNTPTVFNLGFYQIYSWIGKGKNLSHQTTLPILSPNVMSMDEAELVKRVRDKYSMEFFRIYKTFDLTFEQVVDCLVEFQKALVTPNAKFDRFLRNEVKLSEDEREGYKLFKQYGCASCHNGINLGGNSFQKFGVFKPSTKSNEISVDRFAITGRIKDKNVYRVPSLRNVAITAPYFHFGGVTELEDAIGIMAKRNLGRDIDQAERAKIAAFLKTLTGELPEVLSENIEK